MILDKLMEKKDLLAYITARQTILTEEKGRASLISEVKRREVAIRQIQGRITELGYLKKLLLQDLVKTQSKNMWKKAAMKKVIKKGDDKWLDV